MGSGAAVVAKIGFTAAGVAALAAAAVLVAHGAHGKPGHYTAATDLLSPSPYPAAARATPSTTPAAATTAATATPASPSPAQPPAAQPALPAPVVAGLAVVAPAQTTPTQSTSATPSSSPTPNEGRGLECLASWSTGLGSISGLTVP